MNTKLVMAGAAITALAAGVFQSAALAAAIGPPARATSAARKETPTPTPAPAPKPQTDGSAAAEPAAPRLDCSTERVGPALRNVFPPAPNQERADGARILGLCRPAGGDSVLAAALNLSTDPDTDDAITRALVAYATPVAISTLRGLVVSARPIAVRALALVPLVWAGVSDDVVMVLANVRESDWLRTEALRALVAGRRPPDARYLTWLRDNSGPKLGQLTRELLAGRAAPAVDGQAAAAPSPAPAKARAPRPRQAAPQAAVGAIAPSAGAAPGSAPASTPAAPNAASPTSGPAPSAAPRVAFPGGMGPAAAPVPTAPAQPTQPEVPMPPPKPAAPAGPSDGRAVAVAASTVAGAALMLDLSLLGVQDVTPQLLLGSAGAVIGFGTSWALSRFGVRPTIEQASWFANATAWGTLAGITIYGGSGADNYKLRYGSLVLGEMAGMGVGVWSARRWTWTGPEIVLTDSLFLGTAMVGFGVNRLLYETPRVTPAVAIGVLPAMIGSAIAGHLLDPSGNDIALMTTSAVGGAWLGGLASSGIAESEFLASRWGQGGLLIGAGLGYLGGAVAGGFTEVQPLRLKVGVGGIVAGNLMGLGLNLVTTGLRRMDEGELTTADGNRLKLGASIGGLAVGAAAFAAAPHLRLGPATTPMTVWGGAYGAGTMWLASAASYHGQELTEATDAVLYGSMLATGVAGAATGLVLSGHFNPDAGDQWTTFGATAAAISAGWGTTALIRDKPSMADGAGVLGGAAVGLAGGALFTHNHALRPPAVGAGFVGAGYGAIAGLLAPTLSQSEWASGRRTGGGAGLGAGTGAILGTVIGQLSEASAREVTIAGIGTALGLTAGLGAGRMWPGDDTQAERIGILAGMTTLGAASVALMRPLRLREAMPDNVGELIATGTVLGMANGLWTAALLDPTGDPGKVAADRLQGGLLFGGSLGFATAAGLAPRLRYEGGLTLLWGTTIAGTAIGRGSALLIADQPGRGDAAATLVGSLAGTAGGILALRLIDPDAVDLAAATLGVAYGASVGALGPSLGDRTFTDWKRHNTGGVLLGVGAGGVAGLTLRRAFHGDQRSVGLTTVAGLDGAATGVGWGLLLGGDPTGENASSQAIRIGVVAGATAGMGLGMASWSRLTLGSGDLMMISAATVLAGANATMIPTLGHATTAAWNQRRMGGGFLAGAGTASFGATLLAPVVEVDGDLVGNALALDGLFTGAGAGVGALASARADAPVAGMMIGGATGLVLGGALHRRIELDAGDTPILVAGGIEGLWMGAWMPYLLREPAAITEGQRGGGVAAGVFGGLGLSVLVNTAFSPNAGDTEFAMLSSGIGAGIGGGIALLSSSLNDRPAVGLMLGGTGGGLLVGGLLAPRLRIDERVAGSAAVGGVLGATEALLFTWSSRADGRDPYLGAGLLGASVGTGLGLANGIAIGADSNGRLPALAGFTAWGAWMGSLSGSLIARDPHEITAGGVLGSNVGLLAGYGLLRSGAIETSDFGWLSLFGALGTAAGAAVGAPFASRGEPTPILAGMAVGPAVGMGVGAFVLPRLRAASGSSPAVALRSAVTRAFQLRSTAMGSAVSTGAPELSSTVARDLDARRRLRRTLLRALDASIKIADCAPMLGALPTPDANGSARSNASGSSSPPMLVGLVGHWH